MFSVRKDQKIKKNLYIVLFIYNYFIDYVLYYEVYQYEVRILEYNLRIFVLYIFELEIYVKIFFYKCICIKMDDLECFRNMDCRERSNLMFFYNIK